MGLSSRDVLWILKKRLEEEWGRAAGGEKGNGMDPLSEEGKQSCVWKVSGRAWQAAPSAITALQLWGRELITPPESSGEGAALQPWGWDWSSTVGLCQTWHCTFRGTPGQSLGSAQIVQIWREIGRCAQGGVLWLWMFPKSTCPWLLGLHLQLCSLHRPCSSWGACLAPRGRGGITEGLSLWNWGLLQNRQADGWNTLENSGEAVLHPSLPFQTVLSAPKEGLTLISVWFE